MSRYDSDSTLDATDRAWFEWFRTEVVPSLDLPAENRRGTLAYEAARRAAHPKPGDPPKGDLLSTIGRERAR